MIDCVQDQPAPIRLVHREFAAGAVVTPAGAQHLIVIHASRATWTACRDTGSRHLRRRGHVDVIPAGTIGGFDAESACRSVILGLSATVLDSVLSQEAGQAARFMLEPRHMLQRPRIARLAQALAAEQLGDGHADQLFLDAIAHAVATQLTGIAAPAPALRQPLPRRHVARVLDLIESQLDTRLTIDALARESGTSSSALRHWFKQTKGVSLHHYIMQRRVARARQLLQRDDLPLSQVALAAGFAHQSHMARWMRRELGQAPLALRRSMGAPESDIMADLSPP